MVRHYRHKRTGAVIETTTVVGGCWEPIETSTPPVPVQDPDTDAKAAPQPAARKKAAASTQRKKKG